MLDLSPEATVDNEPSDKRGRRFFFIVLAVVAIALFVRLVRLDDLQAEIYGDISIVWEYLDSIRQGNWPSYFVLSSGPLYHYLITPVIAATGLNYLGIKLSSVIVSLGVLAAVFALGRQLIDDVFALIGLFVAGVSSWLLIFSRLGNSQIIVPLLSTTSLWLLVRFVQHGKRRDLFLSAAVAAIGLYGYPQSFILPGVIGVTLVCLRLTGLQVRWRDVGMFALVSLVVALPFAAIVFNDPANFFTGYIGGKLAPASDTVGSLLQNLRRVALSLHISGDTTFRSNPSGMPHLDIVSGALFLLGVVFWLRPQRWRWSPALFLPLALQHIPSMLVLSTPSDVPSASRTLGAAPMAYLLVASGIWWLFSMLQTRRQTGAVIVLGLLTLILTLNAQRYFQDYISGLPYENTPVARIITQYVDMLPPETEVYLINCCWAHNMPEPKSIRNAMARPERFHYHDKLSLTCQDLATFVEPSVLIWSFREPTPDPNLEPCMKWLQPQLYSSRSGLPVFHAAFLRRGANAAALAATSPGMDQRRVSIGDEMAEVYYSNLDIGDITEIFDGDRTTLIQGASANPMIIEVIFPTAQSLNQVTLDLGTMPRFKVTVALLHDGGGQSLIAQEHASPEPDPHVVIPLTSSEPGRIIRIEILDIRQPPADGWHIHVREISFQ